MTYFVTYKVLGCVNHRSARCDGRTPFYKRMFWKRMLNKERSFWISNLDEQVVLDLFLHSGKSSYLIWKSSPQNLEDNSCSRDLKLGLFELSLKLWIRKIYIRQYLLNQVCWTHHLGLVMVSRIPLNVNSTIRVRNRGIRKMISSKCHSADCQICQTEK